ncbi:D-glycerate dehydrogenase [Patescibacteria group bacterium]|nr:D-glycerate dehydrogenase [Patescibacteria group bacterium]
MVKVFITRKIPVGGIELLQKKRYNVVIGSTSRNLSKKEIIKKGRGVAALLCLLGDRVDGEIMDGIGGQLRIIANYAVGVDNIDLKAARKRNIIVTNTPDVLTEAVAGHTVSLILALSRRVAEADRFVRAGKYKGWEPELLLGTELQGRTLGIVGCGRIGLEVARKMNFGFRMQILYYDKALREDAEKVCGATPVSLSRLLKESDVVSLHVPFLPSTRHLIGQKELKMMRETAYLVNTARGPIIDEKALVRALRQKWIRGAALDVLEHEPKLTPGLARLDNVLLTPHIASATRETRDRMSEMAAKNIIAVFSGKTPPNLVS